MTTLHEKVIHNIKELIKYKQELKELYSSIDKVKYKKDINQITFKASNYNKWIPLIESNKDNINSVNIKKDIKDLKLSESLTKKIIEIFEKDRLEEIQLAKNEIKKLRSEGGITLNPSNKDSDEEMKKKEEIAELLLIHGIGEKTAIKLHKEHKITLSKLKKEFYDMEKKNKKYSVLMVEKVINDNDLYKKNKEMINIGITEGKKIVHIRFSNTKYLKHLHYDQLVGLKHVDDSNTRIPREEIVLIEKYVKKVASMMNKDNDVMIDICGSYRRGAKDSGDIDMLLTHKKCLTKADAESVDPSPLNILIHCLTQTGFLVDHLTLNGGTKYMGFCKAGVNNIPRRIDIRFIGYECYGAALLYFTGSREFNKDMRAHALKKGYSVNEYGLTKMKNGKNTGEVISFPTEEEICDFLEYPYKKPTDRNM